MSAIKFLGCSVTGFTATTGWNGVDSTMEIGLVEDYSDNDAFLSPVVGSPVYFSLGNFYFGGLLQNLSVKGDSGGCPIYSATIVDPRSLLAGMEVILSGYNGTVDGFGNLVNVYGMYEATGFGNSQSNAAGMPWNQILAGLQVTLQYGFATSYASPIAYKGYLYAVNFGNLGLGCYDLRLTGNMSLLDIILAICEASGNDLLVQLIDGVITLNTISRRNVPSRGIVTQFIAQTQGAVSKSIGEDMINEVSGKFLVGAKKRDIYFQFNNMTTFFDFHRTNDSDEQFVTRFRIEGPENGTDNTIWPFWGFYENGSPVIATGVDEDHVFVLDTRRVQIPGVGDTYQTSLGEMRSALSSESDWSSYITLHNDLEYLINTNGNYTAKFPQRIVDRPVPNENAGTVEERKTDVYYRHNRVPNPHFGKATRMGLNSGLAACFADILNDVSRDSSGVYNANQMLELIPGKRENGHEKMYELVKAYADSHYGKKFMVSIPEIKGVRQADSDAILFNVATSAGGYLTDAQLVDGIERKLIPLDINLMTNTEDNTLKSYVRFDNIDKLDFTEIEDEKCLYSLDGQSIFVECNVSSDIFFLDPVGLTNPRVLIELSGRVNRNVSNNPILSSVVGKLVTSFVTEEGVKKIKNAEVTLSASPIFTSIFSNGEKNLEAVIPQMVAVALESQVSRYGPWKAYGAIGATDFEEDDTLSPWNYSGYTRLNLAATAKVTDNISFIQEVESGSIEFPGLPDISLGQQLLDIGPYVSTIAISVGSDGVKTTYRMEMWRPRFGTINKAFADKLEKIGQQQIKDRRNFRELVKSAALAKERPKR